MGEVVRFGSTQEPGSPEDTGGSAGRPGPQHLLRDVLGEELRAVRTERGRKLTDVAGDAGVSPQYLSELERGRKEASSEVLESVAGALGYSVRSLLNRAYRLTPPEVSRPSGHQGSVTMALAA